MNPAMTNSLRLKAAKTQEDIMKEVLKDQHQQHKGAPGEGAQQEVEEMMEDQEEAAELQEKRQRSYMTRGRKQRSYMTRGQKQRT